MKALTFDPSSDHFSIQDLPIPQPGMGEVLVKVFACGLNPVDAKIIHWKGMVPDMPATWTPGLDVSGEIVSIGPGVTGWHVGDRVCYHGDMLKPHGGYAEFAVHSADTLLLHPNVSPSIAASTPCAGWTAWRALVDKLRIQPVHSLLIMGASGGVGTFAIQIARLLGVRQIIACCSEKNHGYVQSLGATDVVDYHDANWPEKILTLTNGHGVDRALEAVGLEQDVNVSEVLAFEGEMLTLVSSLRTESYNNIFMRSLSFHQLSLGAGHRSGDAGRMAMLKAGQCFFDALNDSYLKVPNLQKVSLDEVGKVLENMRLRNTVGKFVMTNTDA